MSEYQCYEFVALDRPLTVKQMAELRAISTLAEITPTRFWNEYQWGDLKADPAKLVERYFDAHLYFANWGTHRLMLRIPAARVDQRNLRAYFRGDAARVRIAGEHAIFDLHSEDEEPDSYEESKGSLAPLAPVRTELMRGDLRVAYLAWLLAIQTGAVPEKDVEPPAPPGLSELTAAQATMVEFLRIDEDLISAAADGTDQPSDERPALRKWALALAPRVKDDWLRRAIDDPDLALGSDLLRAFRAEGKPALAEGRRTVAEILAAAERHRGQRERADVQRAERSKKAAEVARKKRLDALAKRADAAWTELEALVEKSAYEEAIKLAIDLRDLAKRDGAPVAFAAPFEAMRKRQLRRRGFFDRWKRQNEPQRWAEKVKLFRQLFRGRDDLYPTRFVSKKTGKPGYAPACSNKFVAGVCELPKVKCGDCTNQAFRPVDDAAVLGHLRGKHVMGVYPMLPEETCWFLAVDFDKSTWKEDARAFAETARRLQLPALVERSRSGNGAHVWFFFSEPVGAATARKMGCYLITETMASRHELSMGSYDRLFPSQDTMPRGGFGNLIALPLQHSPRQAGNSVFLDDNLNAYPDDEQWSVLASAPRISSAIVERIASDATRTGTIIGVRAAEVADDAEDAAPWARPPSGTPRASRIPGPLPPRVSALLAQRLFIAKEGLPSPLLNRIKRLAAFQNPEFYKKQSMRLSTATTPRVISCAEDLPKHVAVPRGCRSDLEELLRVHGVALDVIDERVTGAPLDLRFRGKLTEIQEAAARALLAHDAGVFVAPPGVGKTVIGTYLVASRACSTLILVHRRPLLDQWLAQLALFLGLDRKGIGVIAGAKRTPTGRLDVAMIQSLVRKDSVADLVAGYGQVIVDECHHLAAVQFERVLREVKARYVVGLTATPQRRDGHHPITEMQLGPVRFKVDAKAQAAARPFEHRLIVRETTFEASGSEERAGIQGLYAALARDEARNTMILSDVVRALEEGRSPILLTERKDHLEYFANRLAHVARHLVILQGGMGAKADRAVRAQLDAVPSNEERLLLATGRYIGEGFDDARLDTLFLALPVSWRGTLVQYTGRIQRLHPGKREVRIFDYVDRQVPMLLRMFERRLRGYRAIGYARGEAPFGYAEPKDDLIVEYDDDVLRERDHEFATDRSDEFAEWVP